MNKIIVHDLSSGDSYVIDDTDYHRNLILGSISEIGTEVYPDTEILEEILLKSGPCPCGLYETNLTAFVQLSW